MNSLLNKTSYIEELSSEIHLDLIGVCETWLTQAISTSSINITNYNVLRNDSPTGRRKHGVCIYYHNSLKVGHTFVEHPNTCGLYLSTFKLHILLIYRPPSNTPQMNTELIDYITSFCTGREVCLIGDFNLPTIDWLTNPPTASTNCDKNFLECFTSLGLTQTVLSPTFIPSGRILDLVLCSNPNVTSLTDILPPFPACGHCPIYTCGFYKLHINPSNNNLHHFNWYKANFGAMSRAINEIDWDMLFYSRSLEHSYSLFENILHNLIKLHVPTRQSLNHKTKPWNKNIPQRLKKLKTKRWNDYKTARALYGRNSPQALNSWHAFTLTNNDIKNFKITSRINYERELINQLPHKPKLFHSYIKNQKSVRPKIGPLLINHNIVDTPISMAEAFVNSFASVLTPNTPHNNHPHQTCNSNLSNITISPPLIRKAIANINESGSMGPDSIHPILLKRCSNALSYPLYLLFNKSLTSATVPNSWKLSNVVPIYKKGSPSDPLNYRPISLTSICSKTLERIVVSSINEYLDHNHILSEQQFGFRSGRSVQDQLLITYEFVTREYDQGKIIDLVLFDFKKAFDLVPHVTLINKLAVLGFRPPLLDWIRDFLARREMRVVVLGSLSSPRMVQSGVPQGSVIGPLLFIIFINHITSGIKTKYGLFADDLKLYMSSPCDTTSYNTNMTILQADISLLQARASSWGLTFSPSKCSHLRFVRPFHSVPPIVTLFINNIPIQYSNTARDLGLEVDETLKFHSHIQIVSNKAFGVSNDLLRNTICRSPEFMKTLFITHIRPIIDFCSPIWNTGYLTDIKSLESVQRRWTKHITGFENLSYHTRLKRLSLFSIWGRLHRADLILVWKIFNNKIPTLSNFLTLSNITQTRGHPFKLPTIRPNTEIRKRFFTHRVVQSWNNLTADVVLSPTLNLFKTKMSIELGDRLYHYYD